MLNAIVAVRHDWYPSTQQEHLENILTESSLCRRSQGTHYPVLGDECYRKGQVLFFAYHQKKVEVQVLLFACHIKSKIQYLTFSFLVFRCIPLIGESAKPSGELLDREAEIMAAKKTVPLFDFRGMSYYVPQRHFYKRPGDAMVHDKKVIMEKALKKKLMAAGIKFVRIIWCDNANIIRAKAAHIDYLDEYIDNGVGITAAQMALPVMYDSVIADTGLGPVGEVRLMPDWTTLTILPFAEGHAQVMSDMIISATGDIWDHCPRGFLRRQIAEIDKMGLVLKAAFENEFFLLRRNAEGVLEPADNTVFCATGSMNLHRDFIAGLTDSLTAQGLEVEGYHPESGPGQQEVTIICAEAMRAADRQIVYRETVRGEAARHGLIASFLPKIYKDKAGSGCHLNFSLWREGKNISGDPRQATAISPDAGAFIAGVLDHLPALCAVTIPSSNSYRRIRPHFWAGAFRVWGHQNREAVIRVCKNKKGDQAVRFEYKTADATANPYIALGAFIAAGLDGLSRQLKLPAEVSVDPGLIPEEERNARGIELLPQNLGEALHALRNDPVILKAMGAALAQSYVAVRQFEWDHLKDLELEEEVDLLLERY